MRHIHSKSVATTALLLAVILCLANPAAWAQACPGPPAPGIALPPGGPTILFREGPGLIGDNFVEVPAYSPVNDPAFGNGFVQLCGIFGLAGTTSTMIQLNAATGIITTYTCNQPVAPAYQPCQGVLIRPSIGPVTGVIPLGASPGGAVVEGSWPYPVYSDAYGPVGDNLFGVPRTMVDVDGDGSLTAEDVCLGLGLPAGGSTMITRFGTGTGLVYSHSCGTIPQFKVSPGEALLIRSTCAPAGAACVGSVPIL